MSKSKAQKGGARRRQVPDVDEEHLLDTCLSHVQKAGVCANFCLGAYFHLESSNAVRGSALGEVQHVIRDLLKVSPTLEFKYSTLKSVFGEVLKQFPGLKERFPVSQQGNAAKAFADGILVVCNHARRIGRDEGRLAEACSKLTSIQAAKLEEIASWLKAPKSGASCEEGSVIAATPKKKVKKEEKKKREGVSPGTAAALEEYQIPATQDQESEGESLLASAKKAQTNKKHICFCFAEKSSHFKEGKPIKADWLGWRAQKKFQQMTLTSQYLGFCLMRSSASQMRPCTIFSKHSIS